MLSIWNETISDNSKWYTYEINIREYLTNGYRKVEHLRKLCDTAFLELREQNRASHTMSWIGNMKMLWRIHREDLYYSTIVSS